MALSALYWTLDDLAAKSAVPRITVARFQSANDSKPVPEHHIKAMQDAFERAGVQFSRKGALLVVAVPQ